MHGKCNHAGLLQAFSVRVNLLFDMSSNTVTPTTTLHERIHITPDPMMILLDYTLCNHTLSNTWLILVCTLRCVCLMFSLRVCRVCLVCRRLRYPVFQPMVNHEVVIAITSACSSSVHPTADLIACGRPLAYPARRASCRGPVCAVRIFLLPSTP